MEDLREHRDAREDGGRAKATRSGVNVTVECGWGRLLLGQTFESNAAIAESLREEATDRRDIVLYAEEPHVVLSLAPQEIFLDPSHTFRLNLGKFEDVFGCPCGLRVREATSLEDAKRIQALYAKRHMVAVDPAFIANADAHPAVLYLVAEDTATGSIVGTVMGVDHVAAFVDPERGSSLWALAVDPQTNLPGIGQALVCALAEQYRKLGRGHMDLSVMHDNQQAISLYEKLGFRRVPIFSLKRRNRFNEPLYVAHPEEERLNPYAALIVREARKRGIAVEIIDEAAAYFALSFGGRTIVCRESLSELTTAIAMSRCEDKRVTRRLLSSVGLMVPDQIEAGDAEHNEAFLRKHVAVVVKPARGEQGHGVSVGIRTPEDLASAIARAGSGGDTVIIEQAVAGEDLRIVVIDFRVVAAAVRRPPTITGTGEHTVLELIEKQSRRRAAATGGESTIPLDEETRRCVAEAGYTFDDVLASGEVITVRKGANLHSGGTIHDVTDELHPQLVSVAKRAAEVLDIPVVGLDLIVPSVHEGTYWLIEANERPGLANHEPQPTAERFIDLLFPQTVT